MSSVAFIYGWSEGPWQSKKFQKTLSKHGYLTTGDVANADIIIAHSSGCYLVPKESRAQQLILIGLPYWPERNRFKSVLLNLKVGMQNHARGTNFLWWTNKLAHNLWYIITRPRSSYYVMTKMSSVNLPQEDKDRIITLVRNNDDTFCHPQIQKVLEQTKGYNLHNIAGDHEDCWLHPENYMNLLKSNI